MGFFRDTGDEQDVGSTLRRSEDSQKSREHRSTDNLHSDKMPPTVIDTYRTGLCPLVRRGGFWPLGHLSPIHPVTVPQRVWMFPFRHVKLQTKVTHLNEDIQEWSSESRLAI